MNLIPIMKTRPFIFTDGPHAYSYWILNIPAYLHRMALDW